MKKCKACENKYKYFSCFLEYTNVKVDLIEYKCLCLQIVNKSLMES